MVGMADHKEHLIVLYQRAKAFLMLAQTELHFTKQYAELNLEDIYELRVPEDGDDDVGFDFLLETLTLRL